MDREPVGAEKEFADLMHIRGAGTFDFGLSLLENGTSFGVPSYLIGMFPDDLDPLIFPSSLCFADTNLPARCKAKLASSLCTRYTYAAQKENYPLTDVELCVGPDCPRNRGAEGVDAFLALPTSPTTCFPVTEFDLSK